jgi:hypothetical protein
MKQETLPIRRQDGEAQDFLALAAECRLAANRSRLPAAAFDLLARARRYEETAAQMAGSNRGA